MRRTVGAAGLRDALLRQPRHDPPIARLQWTGGSDAAMRERGKPQRRPLRSLLRPAPAGSPSPHAIAPLSGRLGMAAAHVPAVTAGSASGSIRGTA